MQRNKYLGVALAAGLAVTAVSACGGGGGGGVSLGGTKTSTVTGSGGTGSSGTTKSSGNPTADVTGAVKSIGNSNGVQLVFSLQGSASAFPASSTLTSDQAQAILNSQLTIEATGANGKSLDQSAGSGSSGDFLIALSSGGANLGTFEVLNKTLYARVDINKTADTYGLTKGKAAQAQAALQQDSSAIPGLSALSAGQWVSIDLTPLLQLEQQSAGSTTTTAGSGVSPASEQALVAAFVQAFEQNSQITVVGSADGGTEYQAVVREKGLVTALGQAAQSIPGLSADASKLNASNIPPAQTLTVDLVIKSGQLSELKLPLNQFDTKHQLRGPLTLNLGISGSPAITVPSGATAINISGILSQLGSLGGGTGSTGTTGDTGNTGNTGNTGQ